jgi:competence protein ComEC
VQRFDAIADSRARYREVVRGEQISVGGLDFHVLHPASAEGSSLNDQSIVLRLDHHRISVLLTGDIESGAEADLVPLASKLRGGTRSA